MLNMTVLLLLYGYSSILWVDMNLPQGSVLHAASWVSWPLVRIRVPDPHVLVQSLHSDHGAVVVVVAAVVVGDAVVVTVAVVA